jgi:hypothetical protein
MDRYRGSGERFRSEVLQKSKRISKDPYQNSTPKTKKKFERSLKLKPGDVLIFEEVIGPVTGLEVDADPMRRHAVRITSVKPGEDKLRKTEEGYPIPYVEIEWRLKTHCRFTFCIRLSVPHQTATTSSTLVSRAEM